MRHRDPSLLYVLLKHDTPGPDSNHIIDGALDQLSTLRETLGAISVGVLLSGLKYTLRTLRCSSAPEIQIRVAEAEIHILARGDKEDDEVAVAALLARTMEAAAVFYALQRLMHKFGSGVPLKAHTLQQLLQSHSREKILAGVALDIQSFAEELEATTLQMHSRLLSLLSLKKLLPEVYDLVSSKQNSLAARNKGTRFRTVSMTLGDREAGLSPTKGVNVFSARRAFSMEAFAGRSKP